MGVVMEKIIYLIIFSFSLNALQKVDLNQANKEQLQILPGVGEAMAEKIINERKNGQFVGLEDLKRVESMTDKKIEKMKDLVQFNYTTSKKAKDKIIKNPKKYPILPLAELEKSVLDKLLLNFENDSSMLKRAQKAALLPDISFMFDADKAEILTDKKSKKEDSLSKKDGFDYGFGVKISFELSKLIFNDDEIQISSLILKRQKERQNIIAQVHEHYFSYKKLAEQAQEISNVNDLKLIESKMEIDKAYLDSISDKAFTKFIDNNL